MLTVNKQTVMIKDVTICNTKFQFPKKWVNGYLKINHFTEIGEDTVEYVMKNVIMKFQSYPVTHYLVTIRLERLNWQLKKSFHKTPCEYVV